MKRINEILAVVILSLMAVLLAAVGMRLYDTHVIDRQKKSEIRQQEEVLSRNREAHDRVQEMRQEIEELSGDREKLGQFLEEIRMDSEEVVPVSSMMDFNMSGMSGNLAASEAAPGESEHLGDISGNTIVLDHGLSVSGGDMISDNTFSVSDSDMVSSNALNVSDNDMIAGNVSSISGNNAVSDNTTSVSGNMTSMSDNTTSVSDNATGVSDNTTSVSDSALDISGNGTVSQNTSISENETASGNMLDLLPKIEMVSPEITLAQRRQIRSSMEETLLVNWEDQACLEERGVDFSGKKIACLGDSITAAARE